MTNIVKISVRHLVEYVFRSGSIESGGFRTSTPLTDGTKAHQKIQKTYTSSDQKEVYLKTVIPYETITMHVDGRADGLLFQEDGLVIVDEIKSTSRALVTITEETYPVHWAQAVFYAYIYAKDRELAQMTIQLTYVHVRTEEQKQFQRIMTLPELESFIMEVVSQYAAYAKAKTQHIVDRNSSSKELVFPFEVYREGQHKLAGSVYKTILDKKVLFAKASTGIGKTISTIFPAIKSIGEGNLQRIFYLTAKTITRTAAEDAFRLLIANGLDMKVVTITAKDKICFQEETICTAEHCPFADGYYDRINGAILDIFENESLMSRAVIEAYARKHRVCPFEFSLDLAYTADAVICDYNYIFDPRVSLKRLIEDQKKQSVLLVDEAHNLVERAREMYSAVLLKSSFLQVQKAYKDINAAVAKAAKAVNVCLAEKRKQENIAEKQLDEDLAVLVEKFTEVAEEELVQNVESNQLLLDTYFAASAFAKICRLYDKRFVSYVEVNKSEVMIKLFCLDPSYLLQQMGKGFRSKVFFSATLAPADYYKNLLGGTEDDYVLSIPSPFVHENAEVLVQPLSTRYRDRERTLLPMVQFIRDVLNKQKGNFMIFFPSYDYMNKAFEAFKTEAPDVKTIVQETGMSEELRENFLTAFEPSGDERLVGFAVLGGVFSEGVDLKGDRLCGVMVVGVGLPQIGFERDIIKDYFTNEGYSGFDYAYVYPGMNKVLQAGGRLIRSEADHGTIVLIDDRFLQPKYQKLFPEEWRHYKVVN
ncbi:ATP-dependent DNA helicase [Virgibacillus necropolis]|uniref:ATP-dependent helicase n=1 Tax=Virgibacillus necropolis TaxID=163877 RepID=A0A221M9G2_9BACI|nr:ATP-dependent DNA helicase [Virgibacillus necropolis]ASN04277.1 ATP-dependent helicase [Virgibacillus necropolis]